VPAGFCVATGAYTDFVKTSGEFGAFLESLSAIEDAGGEAGDAAALEDVRAAGWRLRDHLEHLEMPAPIREEIVQAWRQTGSGHAYAVRSSATAEDLPGASFAGQQDTFLNVLGEQSLLDSVRKCWASLFTDRAIVYRRQNGFRHDQVLLAVVVQRMVFPDVSGIMFTADPVTGNRRITSIDASFGLGEALVSGIVSADLYQVKADRVVRAQVARKERAVQPRPGGGTLRTEIEAERQSAPALAEEQAVRLTRMGRSIEERFGSPQDIEWCLAAGEIFILQSRPITTLYPVPESAGERIHLFLSFGHVQMMTEAIKPLGISVIRTLVPMGKSSPRGESAVIQEAGGRLYIDITPLLELRQARKRLPDILLFLDETFSRAVREFVGREEFHAAASSGRRAGLALARFVVPIAFKVLRNILYRNNDRVIEEVGRLIAGEVAAARKELQEASGADRIARIQEMTSTALPVFIPMVVPYIGAGVVTYRLIGSLSRKWLGDADELRSISKSPPGNVTTEMGLALGDLADAVRDHPGVAAYLEQADDGTFWDGLAAVPGGADVLPVFSGFFERYGMRGTGEIDITRPRWREAPTQLVPAILSHLRQVRPGQHRLDFQAGSEEAELAAGRLLDRLRHQPRGLFKARIMRRLIRVHRSLIGIRELPKYFAVQFLGIIKQSIMEEAAGLAADEVIERPEDVFWMSLQEIGELAERRRLDRSLIAGRKEKFEREQSLAPPRVITSEGEIITAAPGAHVPAGALAGTPASAGTVEGLARVVLKLSEARLDRGDILVTPYTDPAWTPLFPLAAGVVTEVGGLMTHGAVVAREYGIPAVVGVDQATRRIRDGQRIRVDGTRGFVQLLEDEPPAL
jgi:phosphoenolpyruvate synthase/pyruvate phosphate dikinase